MHRKVERPITDNERLELRNWMPTTPLPFCEHNFKRKVLTELAGITLGIIALVWFRKQPVEFVIPAACGLYLAWWIFHLKSRILEPLKHWRKTNERVKAFHQALAKTQMVTAYTVMAQSVVKVMHDEGTICLFDIGNNQTYWIDSYHLTMGWPPSAWPNNEFEIIKITGWDEEIGPFCRGKQLKARQVFEFSDLFGQWSYEPHSDGLINQALDDFLAEARVKNHSTTQEN